MLVTVKVFDLYVIVDGITMSPEYSLSPFVTSTVKSVTDVML